MATFSFISFSAMDLHLKSLNEFQTLNQKRPLLAALIKLEKLPFCFLETTQCRQMALLLGFSSIMTVMKPFYKLDFLVSPTPRFMM